MKDSYSPAQVEPIVMNEKCLSCVFLERFKHVTEGYDFFICSGEPAEEEDDGLFMVWRVTDEFNATGCLLYKSRA